MSHSFEKSVKGGTKVKLAPPKSKYVEHILLATQSGEAGVAEVFRTLTHRLRDSTWTVAFKSLIIVHLMIKEGAPDVTLSYLSAAPRNRLAVNSFTDVQTQGHNIRRYAEYLLARSQAFASSKCDHIRTGDGRMKRLTVDKGLLRETEVIQDQVKALVKCDLLTNDVENEISLTAFRLLTRDLLDLFNAENEAVMNVLSHYFEMSRPDAERAIKIYKTFCKQTDLVVQYLGVARRYEYATRLEVPKIKHAPTSLANSLQEYLDDKDFDVNRRQYLAEQEAKRSGKPVQKLSSSKSQPALKAPTQQAAAPSASAAQPPKGPAPDLIDFFESIEQNQQSMAQSPPQFQRQQPTGFVPPQATGFQAQPFHPQSFGFQQNNPGTVNGFQSGSENAGNPFAPQPQQPQVLQSQYTGAGFGGYGPQPAQQQFNAGNAFAAQAFQQQQTGFTSPVQNQPPAQLQPQPTSSNPFRQSMMPTNTGITGFGQSQAQSTNPFARPSTASPSSIPFQGQIETSAAQPLQAQATGTNPFARKLQQPTGSAPPLQVQPTGSTNPFRQSQFVNQQTGTGWQNGPQATMGGLEGLPTIPIFPRPGQAAPQQHQQASPWG